MAINSPGASGRSGTVQQRRIKGTVRVQNGAGVGCLFGGGYDDKSTPTAKFLLVELHVTRRHALTDQIGQVDSSDRTRRRSADELSIGSAEASGSATGWAGEQGDLIKGEAGAMQLGHGLVCLVSGIEHAHDGAIHVHSHDRSPSFKSEPARAPPAQGANQ